MDNKSIIFSVDGNLALRDEVVNFIRTNLKEIDKGQMNNRVFKDGEVNVDFADTVRGKRVYLLSSPNTAEEREKLEFAIDAARRASAKEVIPILPYFPYARQDKKDQHRGAIGAKVFARILEMVGATKVITLELHAEQIEGFFEIPVTNIKGQYLFTNYIGDIAKEHKGNIVLASADAGGGKRLEKMAGSLLRNHKIDIPLVFAHKTRVKDNEVAEMRIIGDVEGMYVIFLDDLLDTGGTLCKAAEAVMANGAIGCEGIVTHIVGSGNAVENIAKSPLKLIMGSTSLVAPDHVKFKTLTIAEEIAKVIIAEDYHISLRRIQEKLGN